MDCIKKIFPESEFGGFANADGTILFYLRVNALAKPTDVVLDVGCGRGEYQNDPIPIRRDLQILHGKVHKVIGIDPDSNAAKNPFLDEFRLLEGISCAWPLEDHSIDLIVTNWTLEHVTDPELFFHEVQRVLKPGGYFCARTSNAWGVVALAARVIPDKFHAKIIQYVSKIRKEEDIFPTHYACNTVPLLRKQLDEHGLTGVVLGSAGLAAYLGFSCLLYFLGLLYERVAPHFLRHTLMVFAEKK